MIDLYFNRLIPESARWLIASGKAETAYKYLQKCATFNKRQEFTSRVKLEVNKVSFAIYVCHHLDICKELISTVTPSFLFLSQSLSTVATMDQQDHSYTYLDLVKTPKLRRLTLFTGIVW